MFRWNKNALRSFGGLAVGAVTTVAGCTPIIGSNLGGGDYEVATLIRLQGVAEAGEQNAWLAMQQCPDGYFVLDDNVVADESGTYRRWRYGCLAPKAEQHPISSR